MVVEEAHTYQLERLKLKLKKKKKIHENKQNQTATDLYDVVFGESL